MSNALKKMKAGNQQIQLQQTLQQLAVTLTAREVYHGDLPADLVDVIEKTVRGAHLIRQPSLAAVLQSVREAVADFKDLEKAEDLSDEAVLAGGDE